MHVQTRVQMRNAEVFGQAQRQGRGPSVARAPYTSLTGKAIASIVAPGTMLVCEVATVPALPRPLVDGVPDGLPFALGPDFVSRC